MKVDLQYQVQLQFVPQGLLVQVVGLCPHVGRAQHQATDVTIPQVIQDVQELYAIGMRQT